LEWRSALHMSPPWLGRREGTRNFERDGQLKCFCFFSYVSIFNPFESLTHDPLLGSATGELSCDIHPRLCF
jgi:hypothetical protein